MIRQLTGTVIAHDLQSVTVDVHGIGYLIATPSPTTLNAGATITLHTHLAVKENALDLYGFATPSDLRMFEHLLTLQKIGPKSALQIMTQADSALIATAVAAGDATRLSKLSGIGKKTAEKIVTDLADRLDLESLDTSSLATDTTDADVLDALIALGYSPQAVRAALQEMPSNAADTQSRIKAALQTLGS